MLSKIEIKDWVKANVEFINNELPLASLESKGLMNNQLSSSFTGIKMNNGTIWKIYQGGDYTRSSGLCSFTVNSISILLHLHIFLYPLYPLPDIQIISDFRGFSKFNFKIYVDNQDNSHTVYFESLESNSVIVNLIPITGKFIAEQTSIDTSTLTLVKDFTVKE